ncbi:MAG: hypothetical protein AAF709_07945 [Pseudomonadota bacterium]
MVTGNILRGVILGLGLAITAQPSVAAPLDDNGLKREIIGRTLSASMGFISMRVLHRPDGTSVMRGTMGSDNGRWEIVSGQICVRWPNRSNGEQRCMSLEPLGNGKYRSSFRGIVLTAEQ